VQCQPDSVLAFEACADAPRRSKAIFSRTRGAERPSPRSLRLSRLEVSTVALRAQCGGAPGNAARMSRIATCLRGAGSGDFVSWPQPQDVARYAACGSAPPLQHRRRAHTHHGRRIRRVSVGSDSVPPVLRYRTVPARHSRSNRRSSCQWLPRKLPPRIPGGWASMSPAIASLEAEKSEGGAPSDLLRDPWGLPPARLASVDGEGRRFGGADQPGERLGTVI